MPRQIEVGHPKDRDSLLVPDKRTTFGVVEMTTGCGRRCAFCQPDLNPRISVPKAPIMDAVRANVAAGNRQKAMGFVAGSTLGRVWLMATAVLLVGIAEREAGLAAALLLLPLFTLSFAAQGLTHLLGDQPEVKGAA